MSIEKNTTDSKLVKSFQKGDIKAFDHIFEKYSSRLFGFALGYLKSKEEAEGLVQEVFLKIWENRKNLKAESSLKSYIFTIAYHLICRHFRTRKIHNHFMKEQVWPESETLNLQERIEYKSALEQVERLIELLPEKQKTIFIKSRKEGKSSREIGQEMNISPGTVDNNISAALRFLRKKINPGELKILLYFAIFIL